MEELLRFDMTAFCSKQCARSFPYQGTEEYSRRIEALRSSLAGPPPAPLSGKACPTERTAGAAADAQAVYFSADDIGAAVRWLKDRMRNHTGNNEALLKEIDNAFPDITGSSQNDI